MADVLTELELLVEDREVNHAAIVSSISKARFLGHSWEAIGNAMGISRQGAMKYKPYIGAS